MNAEFRSNGLRDANGRILSVLRQALRRTGKGRFQVRTERYRDLYRITLRGMTSWRFYASDWEVIAFRRDLRSASGAGLAAVERCIADALLGPLTTTGHGEFAIGYERDRAGNYTVTIFGTEEADFIVPREEIEEDVKA